MLRRLVKDALQSTARLASRGLREPAPTPTPAPPVPSRPAPPPVVVAAPPPVVVAAPPPPPEPAPAVIAAPPPPPPVIAPAPPVEATPAPPVERSRPPSFTSGAQAGERGGLHHAEDGTPYWGPIDNESARARAAGLRLIIDQHECINCGTCVENTDAVFALPDEGKAVAVRQEGPMDLIQDAIDACPVTCIHWTDDPARFPQLNDAAGRPLSEA